MTVTCIVPEYPPDLPAEEQGGVTTYFMNMVMGYRQAGLDVVVLTSAYRAEIESEAIGQYGETIVRAFRHRGTFGSGPMARLSYEVEREIGLVRNVWRRRAEIQVLEIPDWQTPFLAPALVPRAKTFMKLHGPSGFVRRLNTGSTKWWWRYVDFRERFWARRVRILDAGSPVLREFATQEWGLDRTITLSPDPFDLATVTRPDVESTEVATALRIASGTGGIVVLNVGRFEYRKGQHIVCESLNHLDVDGVRWSLHFVGPDTPTGPGGVSYKSFCEGLLPPKYRQRVYWHPPVRLSQLNELYGHADLVIVSSLDGNYGYTTLQPLAAGVCVITTLEPGQETSQYVTELQNGLLYRSDDPIALAKQIRTALLDAELRRRLAARAAQRAGDDMSPRVAARRVFESIGTLR